MLRTFIWLIRTLFFVALFGLAVKNSGSVELRLYFGNSWQAPLSLVILGSFVAGTIIGITAGFATMIRQRRELGRQAKQLREHERRLAVPAPPSVERTAAELTAAPLDAL